MLNKDGNHFVNFLDSTDIPSTQFPRANVGQADTEKIFAEYAAKTKSTITYIFLSGILLFVAVAIATLTQVK